MGLLKTAWVITILCICMYDRMAYSFALKTQTRGQLEQMNTAETKPDSLAKANPAGNVKQPSNEDRFKRFVYQFDVGLPEYNNKNDPFSWYEEYKLYHQNQPSPDTVNDEPYYVEEHEEPSYEELLHYYIFNKWDRVPVKEKGSKG